MAGRPKDVAGGALAYAHLVREWAYADGSGETVAALAESSARFAASEAYGTLLEWRWDALRTCVPALDPDLAVLLTAPASTRLRNEVRLAEHFGAGVVIDLVGDSLTLRLALEGRMPLALAGEGKGLRLWRGVIEEAAPDSAAYFIDVTLPDTRPPLEADWIRCRTLSHWLELVAALPPAWARLQPIVTCDAQGVPAPADWEETLVSPDGGIVSDPSAATLRVLCPPGRRLA